MKTTTAVNVKQVIKIYLEFDDRKYCWFIFLLLDRLIIIFLKIKRGKDDYSGMNDGSKYFKKDFLLIHELTNLQGIKITLTIIGQFV